MVKNPAMEKIVFIIITILILSAFGYLIISTDGDVYEIEPTDVEVNVSTIGATNITAGSAVLRGYLTDKQNYRDLKVSFKFVNTKDELDGVFTLKEHVIDTTIEEGDGLSVADIDGDGFQDPIVGTGLGGSVFWFSKEDPDHWKKHKIADGLIEVEGTSAADFDDDGKIEVIIFDQATADPDKPNVYLAKQETEDPAGAWSLVVLDENAPHVQQGLIFDVDGDSDLDFIYAYEGKVDGEGGFYWMECKGGNVLDPDNWGKHEIGQIEGAWWIDYNSPKDWGGKGTGDIAVGVRAGSRSPPSASGGVYIYKQPSDPKQKWERIVIDEEYPVLQVVSGDFTGSGNELDLCAGACHDSDDEGLYIYDHDNNWSKLEVETDHNWWGTYGYDIDKDGRFEILSGDRDTKDLNLYSYNKASNRYEKKASVQYEKPDDQMIFSDINGDGLATEVFIGSGTEGKLAWFGTFELDGSFPVWTIPQDLTHIGTFERTIIGLDANTTYAFKAIVIDPHTGRSYEGEWKTFTTGL